MNHLGHILLRIHGSILALAALVSAGATTYGRLTGDTIFGFLHDQPIMWVGLIQAYLLMAIIAVLLIIHAWDRNPRRWHAVGALAHIGPLTAALTSIPLFAGLGATGLAYGAIAFHALFFVLEGVAFLSAQKR
jgi:hypothetical protein